MPTTEGVEDEQSKKNKETDQDQTFPSAHNSLVNVQEEEEDEDEDDQVISSILLTRKRKRSPDHRETVQSPPTSEADIQEKEARLKAKAKGKSKITKEPFEEQSEEQIAMAVNMSIEEYRAHVAAEKKRQQLEMIGLITAQRLAQEEVDNLSEHMSPLQAQEMMILEAEKEVDKKARVDAIFENQNLKWLEEWKNRVHIEKISKVSASRLKKDPDVRITISREGSTQKEVIMLRQLSTYSLTEWCEMLNSLPDKQSRQIIYLARELTRLLDKARRLNIDLVNEASQASSQTRQSDQ